MKASSTFRWSCNEKGHREGADGFEDAVSSLDILPTALDAAGTNPSPYSPDGVSPLPHLRHERNSPPHLHPVWRTGANAAVRQGHWKLLVSWSSLTRLSDVAEHPEVFADIYRVG